MKSSGILPKYTADLLFIKLRPALGASDLVQVGLEPIDFPADLVLPGSLVLSIPVIGAVEDPVDYAVFLCHEKVVGEEMRPGKSG